MVSTFSRVTEPVQLLKVPGISMESVAGLNPPFAAHCDRSTWKRILPESGTCGALITFITAQDEKSGVRTELFSCVCERTIPGRRREQISVKNE